MEPHGYEKMRKLRNGHNVWFQKRHKYFPDGRSLDIPTGKGGLKPEAISWGGVQNKKPVGEYGYFLALHNKNTDTKWVCSSVMGDRI